jgi:hypothetical protein
LGISQPRERSPPVDQRGAGPLFRVRESSSSRSLLANFNENKMGVGNGLKRLDASEKGFYNLENTDLVSKAIGETAFWGNWVIFKNDLEENLQIMEVFVQLV